MAMLNLMHFLLEASGAVLEGKEKASRWLIGNYDSCKRGWSQDGQILKQKLLWQELHESGTVHGCDKSNKA